MCTEFCQDTWPFSNDLISLPEHKKWNIFNLNKC